MNATQEPRARQDAQDGGPSAAPADAYIARDPQAFAMNIARALEQLGRAASEWLKPRERGEIAPDAGPAGDLLQTLSEIAEFWMAQPQKSHQAQLELMAAYRELWAQVLARFSAAAEPPTAEPTDGRRFADAAWRTNPFFHFLQQAHAATARHAETMVLETEGPDERAKRKALFYMRQVTQALSPENFVLTNPQVWRETAATSGDNLVRGMARLADDLRAGRGRLRLRQTDEAAFGVGVNLAITPGKVIARNDLCEIIHYAPTTATVYRRPLLFVPPWINKFYILDLNAKKSLVKWCVDQGHSVFMLSWVNPQAGHAAKGWEDYIRDGIGFALDVIEQASGETAVNAAGYCIGGTLLASALALHAQEGERRVHSATLLAAQTDFTHAGDLAVFIDAPQLEALERHMRAAGYLDGAVMAGVFNMLRASELIWPHMVDNYLRGVTPPPFDLLYWNSDSTRVTAACHSFYLRNCYLENNLAHGRMEIAGKALKLADVTIPVYSLGARDDHIAPAGSVFAGAALFGGPVQFVLGGAGHIAGVINPPQMQKYHYWTGAPPGGDFGQWQSRATAAKGSWWPHWHGWLAGLDDSRTAARPAGGGALAPLCDAPGTYVLG